jgi:predicted DNA-binding ribbon-helix-helix protein
MAQSSIPKRTIFLNGKKTRVSLEDEFWSALREIAGKRGIGLSRLVAEIDERRTHTNLFSAVRLFVLDYYRPWVKRPL